MIERENVIKELEETAGCFRYLQTVWGSVYEPIFREHEAHCNDAIAILKEQEAVVPGIAQDVDGIFATCGNCKKKLWKMMGLEFVVNPGEKPRFCPHCGRLVKWK